MEIGNINKHRRHSKGRSLCLFYNWYNNLKVTPGRNLSAFVLNIFLAQGFEIGLNQRNRADSYWGRHRFSEQLIWSLNYFFRRWCYSVWIVLFRRSCSMHLMSVGLNHIIQWYAPEVLLLISFGLHPLSEKFLNEASNFPPFFGWTKLLFYVIITSG